MDDPSGHSQHRGGDSFDCCTERYEIVVLLLNSKLTKDNNCNMYVVYLFLYFVYLVSADPDIGDIDGK